VKYDPSFHPPGLSVSDAARPLFLPLAVGALALGHRIVMAPIGRARANPHDGTATGDMVRFYGSRATPGGLIVAESSAVSAAAASHAGTPGMFTAQHVNAWRAVTDAVHSRQGLIVAQLWHGGRLARPPDGSAPYAPSGIEVMGRVYAPVADDRLPLRPRAIDEDDIDQVVDQFRRAAENASDAGFDGVELHCANGCLVDQFLHGGSNRRSDSYGGSIENRSRLLIEVVQTLTAVWGADRVGVRLSPFGQINDMHDHSPQQLFAAVLDRLDLEDVAYVHLMEPGACAGLLTAMPDLPDAARLLRAHFPRILIASGNFDAASADESIRQGIADAVSFGRSFLANPDLPARFAQGRPLEPYEPERIWSLLG
jgi:N-ethylmaleimide reductase